MAKRIIRWPELKDRLGGENSPSKVTVWRWERDGLFPKRLKIGANVTAWFESEIDKWLEQRAAERKL